MYNWLWHITDFNHNLTTIMMTGFGWPSLIFFGFLQYLRTAEKRPIPIKRTLILYVLLAIILPLLFMILSCVLHPKMWKHFLMMISIILGVSIFWVGSLPRTIVLFYLHNKKAYDKIFKVNNATITMLYTKPKIFVYLFAGAFWLPFIFVPIGAFVNVFIFPYGPAVGSIVGFFVFTPFFFVYFGRWLLRCPLCCLPLFDAANENDVTVSRWFKNTWFVFWKKEAHCCNCCATFLLKVKSSH